MKRRTPYFCNRDEKDRIHNQLTRGVIGRAPTPLYILDAQSFLPKLGSRKPDLLTRPAIAERDYWPVLRQQEHVCPPVNTPGVPASLHPKRLSIGGQSQPDALNLALQRFASSSLMGGHACAVC